MNRHVRWIIVLLANLLLVFLVAELNHGLAIWSLHIFIGGLLVTFGSLHLGLKQGLLANGITGLFLDAAIPLPFGVTFLLIMVCHTVIFSIRGNFARENIGSGLLIAVVLNLVLMLAYGLLAARGTPAPGIFWTRIGLDLLLSTIAIAVIAPWFFSLQRTTLTFVGVDLEAEQREAK